MLPRILFFVVIAIAMAFVAKHKGFKPLNWLLAGSIIGFVVLIFLPAATQDGIDQAERDKRAKLGNLVGGFLSIIVIIFIAMILALIIFPTYL